MLSFLSAPVPFHESPYPYGTPDGAELYGTLQAPVLADMLHEAVKELPKLTFGGRKNSALPNKSAAEIDVITPDELAVAQEGFGMDGVVPYREPPLLRVSEEMGPLILACAFVWHDARIESYSSCVISPELSFWAASETR
jgi:hypothetical protein